MLLISPMRYIFTSISWKTLGSDTEGFLPLESGIAKCENRVPPIELWIIKPHYNSNKTGGGSLIKHSVKGGFTLSTLSIHPVEYLRLHRHYDEMRTRLLRVLGLLLNQVQKSVQQITLITAVILVTELLFLPLCN